jgi:hypothetical protein
MRESNVVHVSAPVTVVGDIHGWVISDNKSAQKLNQVSKAIL